MNINNPVLLNVSLHMVLLNNAANALNGYHLFSQRVYVTVLTDRSLDVNSNRGSFLAVKLAGNLQAQGYFKIFFSLP